MRSLYVNFRESGCDAFFQAGPDASFQAGPFETEQDAREFVRCLRSIPTVIDCFISSDHDPERIYVYALEEKICS